MRAFRFDAYRGETDIRKKKSVRNVVDMTPTNLSVTNISSSLYVALMARFASQTACVHVKASCKPVLKRAQVLVCILRPDSLGHHRNLVRTSLLSIVGISAVRAGNQEVVTKRNSISACFKISTMSDIFKLFSRLAYNKTKARQGHAV
jgi:hypothetical protein